MPIHPIQRTRSGEVPEVRLSRGAVVEYEQHGKPILSVVIEERKGKWHLVTELGDEATLAAERLFLLPGSTVPPGVDRQGQISALRFLSTQADNYDHPQMLETLWERLHGVPREYSVLELAKELFEDSAPVQTLAVRRRLLSDKVYFKRAKNGFEPKSPEVVEESKLLAAQDAEREVAQRELEDALLDKLAGRPTEFPPEIYVLEDLAAFGSASHDSKIAVEILENVCAEAELKLEGKVEERAFKLLERVGHFQPDEDLNLYRTGRSKLFPKDVELASQEIRARFIDILDRAKREVVAAPSITIDGEDTLDIDDALSLEPFGSGWKLGVHISDVTLLIERDTLLDREAFRRATSIYTPDYTVPMLPRELSEGCVSLIAGERRGVLSFYAEIGSDGAIIRRWIVPSEIRVDRRLSYVDADRMLYDESDSSPTALMLQTLWKIVGMLEAQRIERGALQFNRRELTPQVRDGRVVLEESGEELPARRLVSELMIFANESAALFGKERGIPLLYRGQEPPDRDIPTAALAVVEGPAREYFMRGLMKRSVVSFSPLSHAGLGVEAYIQGTSPIRRYGDLVNQRQLVAVIQGARAPYEAETLGSLNEALEGYLDEAYTIQRLRSRYFIQRYLQQEGLQEVDGVIVKSEGGRALIELEPTLTIHPFYPRSLNESQERARIGKTIRVSVEKNNPKREQLILREIV